MTREQQIARRQELRAPGRLKAIEEYRRPLYEAYFEDTGELAMLVLDDMEYEDLDTKEFVDWLILRYVAAAGPTYAMTEADKKEFVDKMRANEKRRPNKAERELVERYVGKKAT